MRIFFTLGIIASIFNSIMGFYDHNISAGIGWLVATLWSISSLAQSEAHREES